MARSYASSNSQRESSNYGEATLMAECKCENQLKVITSWTNENPGQRFWVCRDNGNARCRFIQWFGPPMCKRSKKIIPGLFKRLNKEDEELKSLQMRLRLVVNGARTEDKYWFKSWQFKVVVLVIIVVLTS
ncbi:PREDICTED: uncharacterized protein LOC109189132 [Ipomoea nil]|uniref:uncharacterized protein LOC109189132 n=1 Tax=Ipomoea nil TaxID=35883 RepID=UPI000901ADC8|nr:PREDICTED: uncharacterized protein LOC109189132 [Ipomoea nil]